MYYQKKIMFIIMLSFLSIPGVLLADSATIFKDPNKIVSFEKELYKLLPVYTAGIYPKAEILAKGLKEEDIPGGAFARVNENKEKIKKCLNEFLVSELKPKDFKKSEWLCIKKLRWNHNYIVGEFIGNGKDKYKDANVQFQADDRNIAITITSDLLFSQEPNELTNTKFLDILSDVINFPEDKLVKINVNKNISKLAGLNTCYGKLNCEWDEKTSDITKRKWWSYIPFWYVKGKLFVAISTVNWEKNLPSSDADTWSFDDTQPPAETPKSGDTTKKRIPRPSGPMTGPKSK